jgi:hypothetical protein
MNAPEWDQPQNIDEASFPFKGFVFSADYWFRLKETRIEFMPTVSFRSLNYGNKFHSYSFHLNTNFYLLDLFGDCDCPTFTKSEPIIQKGFFIQISPGFNFTRINYDVQSDPAILPLDPITRTDNTSFADIGFGIGLDIGLSNLITLTPIARYRLGIGANWDGAEIYNDNNSAGARLSWFEFGVRAGIRFDANRY